MSGNIQLSARNFAAKMSVRCKHKLLFFEQRASRLLKSVRARRTLHTCTASDVLSLVGIVAGAAACGLWLGSSTAALFVFILLLLLARMGRSLERITALLRTQSAAALSLNWRPASGGTANARNIYVSTKAMERLRPWVEDESSLSEESAKAYCSVLLDTLAILDPKLASRAQAEDTWS
jgi:hypothetical protein